VPIIIVGILFLFLAIRCDVMRFVSFEFQRTRKYSRQMKPLVWVDASFLCCNSTPTIGHVNEINSNITTTATDFLDALLLILVICFDSNNFLFSSGHGAFLCAFIACLLCTTRHPRETLLVPVQQSKVLFYYLPCLVVNKFLVP